VTKAPWTTTSRSMHTISSNKIQTVVRVNLPGELSKHTVSEGSKVVSKYTSSNKLLLSLKLVFLKAIALTKTFPLPESKLEYDREYTYTI